MTTYVQYIVIDADHNMFMYFVKSNDKANEDIKQLGGLDTSERKVDKLAEILRESTVDEVVINANEDYFCSGALNRKVQCIVSHFVFCWPGIYHESDDYSVDEINMV